MEFAFCDRGHVADIVFVIQARINCHNCAERRNIKEQAALAQALREDYGNINMSKAMCLDCTIATPGICKH